MFDTMRRESLRTRVIGAWAVTMSNPEIEGKASAVPVRCPKCGDLSQGCTSFQWPDILRRLAGVRPWACPSCACRFYVKRKH